MTLIYRSDKGSPLTSAEGDGNIHDLDDRLTFVEENPPEAVSIDEITQDVPGGPLTILMTDSTTQGPFTLPSGMPNFRGDWLPSTLYAINDWITASGALYAVIFAHTSDLTFDPGANDGGGHDYYQALLELPDSLLPDDGVAGQVIKTADGTSNTLYFDDETLSPPPVVEITATSFAPSALTDGNKYYRCTHASGCLVTLPLDADVAFAIGTELHFRQSSAVPVVFDQGSDTPTINVTDGFDPQTDRDGAVVTVKKIDTDEWDLFGLLSAG